MTPGAEANRLAVTKTDLEEKADVDSLESLHLRRRALLPEYARLRAMHGSNGKWDAKRKQMLEALKVQVRFNAQQRGEKTTDAGVDAMAHADDTYVTFIDRSIEDAVRFVELEVEMHEIAEEIENRTISIYSYNAETRLR